MRGYVDTWLHAFFALVLVTATCRLLGWKRGLALSITVMVGKEVYDARPEYFDWLGNFIGTSTALLLEQMKCILKSKPTKSTMALLLLLAVAIPLSTTEDSGLEWKEDNDMKTAKAIYKIDVTNAEQKLEAEKSAATDRFYQLLELANKESKKMTLTIFYRETEEGELITDEIRVVNLEEVETVLRTWEWAVEKWTIQTK